MATWIDDEGHLRLKTDERHQFLSHIPIALLDPWIAYDSWDLELAIRLITIGYNLDILRNWERSKDWPDGTTGKDAALAYIEVYERGMSIAKSSIAAGLLKTHDTPKNWLAWAQRKGYCTKHLSPLSQIAEMERAIEDGQNDEVRQIYAKQIDGIKKLLPVISSWHPDTQSKDTATTHQNRKRTHHLANAITSAEKHCADPTNTGSVWVALSNMARAKSHGLIGVTNKGIQYLDANDEPKEFSKRQLTAYLTGSNLNRKRPPKSAQAALVRAS